MDQHTRRSAIDRIRGATKTKDEHQGLKEITTNKDHLSQSCGEKIKHLEEKSDEVRFMYEPPKIIEEREERLEDSIPDLPENQEVREFLRKAPQQGLWMPLGKEVKIMKCWRCGAYGHRTGDRDCPKFLTGSEKGESFYKRHEDPMAG
eukprot:TRINITY_DN7014_c0_g1_i3.p1 TRINITY_DN7014_c0_g1~~TRINITY_DN7014_c0_g1_i3.p1  ORF type:complete len:148 (-),score=30.57 TRINITY_DN7014_c0_g1_i3:203-646(-)